MKPDRKWWYDVSIDITKWINASSASKDSAACIEVAPFDRFTEFYETTFENRNVDPARFVKLCRGEHVVLFLSATLVGKKETDQYWKIYKYFISKSRSYDIYNTYNIYNNDTITFSISADYMDRNVVSNHQYLSLSNDHQFYIIFCVFVCFWIFGVICSTCKNNTTPPQHTNYELMNNSN